jgi:hypothetical protein
MVFVGLKLSKNIVLLKDIDNPNNALTKERQLFKIIFPAEQIENIYAREQGTRIFVLKKFYDAVLLKDKIIAIKNQQ